MSVLRIRLNETRNFSSQSKSKLARNQSQNKKSIEIVREKIDHHLKKTYQKLKLDNYNSMKSKEYHGLTENNIEKYQISNKDIPLKDNVKHICLKRRNNFSANGQYFTPSVKQNTRKAEITLIDNRDVMEYIQIIYETYNIKNPLIDEELDALSSQATIEKKKDNWQLDQQFSLNSARTTKEISQNIAEISEFDVDSAKLKATTNKKKKKLLITLRSNSVHKHGLKSTKRDKANPLLISKQNNPTWNSVKEGNNKHRKISSQLKSSQSSFFRYCFACEKPIFQQNIRKHQSQCFQLQKAFTFSFSKIDAILEEKIGRTIAQINKKILDINSASFNQRFKCLQDLIKNWVGNLPNLKQTDKDHKFAEQHRHQNFLYQYNTIKQCLNDNFYEGFDLLGKLNWFIKLQKNIRKIKDKF